MTAPINEPRTPPYKLAGVVLSLLMIAAIVLVYFQFRGDFLPREQLTMMSNRAGLSMDPGAKVTYNGVEIGRVASVDEVSVGDQPRAKITMDVDPKYIKLLPANVDAKINATTVFGNKYISFSSPKDPSEQRIKSSDVIDATHVTTEFNTLFETLTSVTEKVDPIKLNQTLTATAQALQGLGDRFGKSIIDGNEILGDLNPKMPQIRRDNQLLADLGETYANAAPDLFDGLENAVTTARTLNEQQGNIDQALMASIGFGNTGGEIFERGGPYLIRGAQDLIPTSAASRRVQPRVVLHHPQLPRRRAEVRLGARWQRLFVEHPFGDSFPRQRVRLSGQPAQGERPWRTGRQAWLLAARHQGSVARAVSGDGHRRVDRAVQPHRARLAVRLCSAACCPSSSRAAASPANTARHSRPGIRLGPSIRGAHDQPMKITGTAIKLGAFALVLLLFTAIIIVVFGQMRFDRTTGYSAIFSNASGLRAGQFVRASGVEVGKVSKVELHEGGRLAKVDFAVERDLQLFQGRRRRSAIST